MSEEQSTERRREVLQMIATDMADDAASQGAAIAGLAKVVASLLPEEPASRIAYLLWSNKHEAWWRPDAKGYTYSIDGAGRYSEAEAVTYVVRSAQCGQRAQVTCMVAAPENWSEVRAAAHPDPEAPCCGHFVSSHCSTGCLGPDGCPCETSEAEARAAVSA